MDNRNFEFNLEIAKKITNGEIVGPKIKTRDGSNVRILCFDLKNNFCPIVAAVELENDLEEKYETVFHYSANGKFCNIKEEHRLDLFVW